MDARHTVYETDHRYNPKTFETIASYRSANPTQTSGTTSVTTTAAAAVDVDIHHSRAELHSSWGSSFRDEINHVLQQWRQLQEEKKQQQSVVKSKQPPDYDEFDRLMEEDLANQLNELEQQEKEYKQLEQMMEEQLKLDDPREPMALFVQDFMGQVEAQQSYQVNIDGMRRRY